MLSEEQRNVVRAVILEDSNVIVNSVAGCGKTTTSVHMCKVAPEKQFLIVTYNSKLRLDTVKRVNDIGLSNCTVHTYHSLCYAFYTECIDDRGLVRTVKGNLPPKRSFKYDVIILDEQQDMYLLTYRFICKFLRDMNNTDINIIVLGDSKQAIYQFKGADERYIEQADVLFRDFSKKPWKHLAIHESFRLTSMMASFVNSTILGYDKIISNKHTRVPVTYITANMFNPKSYGNRLRQHIRMGKYEPGDIFVLAYSVKGGPQAPITRLENFLTMICGYLCYTPNNDVEELKDEEMKGKIAFSSFHQAKGRERKLVILVGFDSYMYDKRMNGENADETPILNSYYVGTTRASDELIVIQDYSKARFPTIKMDIMDIPGTRVVMLDKPKNPVVTKKDNIKMHIDDLLSHLTNDIIFQLDDLLEIKTTIIDDYRIEYNTSVTGDRDQIEAVSDIYGVVITMFTEMSLVGSLTVPKLSKKTEMEIKDILDDISNEGDITGINIPALVKYASAMIMQRNGFMSRYINMTDYSWVDEIVIEDAASRITGALELDMNGDKIDLSDAQLSTIHFEVPNNRLFGHNMLEGVVDIVTPNSIFEIKFTSKIRPDHIYQIVLYSYMMDENFKKLKLYNVRTGELLEIKVKDIYAFVQILIDFKNRSDVRITDDEFFQIINSDNDDIEDGDNTNSPSPTFERIDNSDLLEKLKKCQIDNNK